jgi:hypothetical protein
MFSGLHHGVALICSLMLIRSLLSLVGHTLPILNQIRYCHVLFGQCSGQGPSFDLPDDVSAAAQRIAFRFCQNARTAIYLAEEPIMILSMHAGH